MDPNIRNFSQIEKFIKENPREADAQAFEWQQFLKANAQTSPQLYSIETAEEFYKWAEEHPEKNIDPSIWVGKEISDSYYYLRDQHENEQMRTTGGVDASSIPTELAVLPILAASFLERPKIMQDDKDYKKIEETLKKEWIEKNPGKDFSFKEGIDYLYGSLDDAAKQSLAKDAENSFRNNPKFKKRVERYDKEKKKIYKNPKDDPNLKLHESITEAHINARLEYLKTHDDEKTPEEIANLLRKKSQEDFASRFPEKTNVYGKKIEGLQDAQEKIQIKESLASYGASSGKEIKYVEKQHRVPDISVSDATKILEGISSPQENPSYTISTPAPTESQVSEPPPSGGRPSGGGVNRGISAINNFARRGFPNPLGKVGQGVVQQAALRGFAAFLAGPGLPVAIALGLVLLFTVIIVMGFGGAPSPETNNQGLNLSPTATQSATPTKIIITPAPAEP